MKKPLIVHTGPTAVGKTKLSIALAKAVNGEIISADSMQVYRHMDIGSAKITPEEMDGVIWWMCWSPQKILILSFSSRWQKKPWKKFMIKAGSRSW